MKITHTGLQDHLGAQKLLNLCTIPEKTNPNISLKTCIKETANSQPQKRSTDFTSQV